MTANLQGANLEAFVGAVTSAPGDAAHRQSGMVARGYSSSSAPAIGQVLLSMTVGGGEVLAARIARRLSDRYRFVFFCLDDVGTLGHELRADGFTVHTLGRTPGIDWRAMRRLARLTREENLGVLHVHQYTPFFYAAASRLLGMPAPIVFTEHGRFFPDVVSGKRRLANRLLLRRRDRVVGVGRSVRQALIENEGIRADRVEVIYNGIDLGRYEAGSGSYTQRVPGVQGSGAVGHGAPSGSCGSPGAGDDGTLQIANCKLQIANRSKARAELGFSPSDFLIVHVARLDPIKDHPTAIRAFERVKAALPEAKLAVVGEGPARSVIEGEIARRGLGESVRMAGLRSDVPRWLAAADVAWLTSVSEGIPLTLIEAMAAGLPVVATDVGGICEVVAAGETGLLTPAADDAALAEAVLRLARDAERCQCLGEAGRRRAFDHFSEDRMHCEYARIYQELLRV